MEPLPRNLGLDLVRATEAGAVSAARWMGLGNPGEADLQAHQAVYQAILQQSMNCKFVALEKRVDGKTSPLRGLIPGSSESDPPLDLIADPIDGRRLLAQGRDGALSVAAIAPRGSVWSPTGADYLEKIVVSQEVAEALVPECLDAPAAWILALIARVKGKPVRDLTVFILDRPRHEHIIEEVRRAGARVMLRADGDIAGAVLAAYPDGLVDVLLGIGGAIEGVLAACAVRAMRGGMLVRLAPQSSEEKHAVLEAGLDAQQVLSCEEIIESDQIFFAATGITDGPLLRGVHFRGAEIHTQSLLLRGLHATRRIITTIHGEDLQS